MLVLTRKLMESFYIGDDICVTVVRMEGGQVRLGIEAPREIPIVRGELVERAKARAMTEGTPERASARPRGGAGLSPRIAARENGIRHPGQSR